MEDVKAFTIYLEQSVVRKAKIILAQQDEEREKNNEPRSKSGLLNELLKKWVKEQEK